MADFGPISRKGGQTSLKPPICYTQKTTANYVLFLDGGLYFAKLQTFRNGKAA